MRSCLILCAIIIIATCCHAQQNMSTARRYFPAVLDDVKAAHGDSVVFIGAVAMNQAGTTPIKLDYQNGKSEMWAYAFLSVSDKQLVSGLAVDHEIIGRIIGEVSSQDWPPGADTIYSALAMKNWWIDSDTAAMSWTSSGLIGFLDQRPSAIVNIFRLTNTPEYGVVWSIGAIDGGDTLSCFIDAYTSEVLGCTLASIVEEDVMPAGWDVSEVYPNPITVGSSCNINIKMLESKHLIIDVYDVLGRYVGCIADQRWNSEASAIIVPNNLVMIPGVYFVHISAGSHIAIRKFLVLK